MKLLDYVNIRLGLSARHRRLIDRPIPAQVGYFYCLGGITFSLFVLQVLTGLLLSVHYSPSETEAYQSIQRLHTMVPLGQTLRSVHHWAANLMVVTIFLHMLRVFITGSFKNPRELNWVAGALLLLLTLAFGFTGYLLPWDQKSYWATVVGTNMVGSLPLLGPGLSALMRGGAEVTGQTLLRFYSLHVLWLPFLTIIFLWVHFHILRRVGISGGL
ncbi:MAG: cytochrome b6 [Nitrospirae bacterium GWD2_57_9]|nr:MAG: cytochrome b6 [Nitrospirae bacterium GWD2_57_9]OGW48381.1 MAG: cytochrome b6 [Nitrospirae bacterium GWC2_57_9]